MKLMTTPIRFLLPICPDLGRTSVRAALLACLPVFALLAAGPVHAATLTVCPSGCDFTAIQPAVDSASSGDTVRIFSGVYPGPVVITNKSLVLWGNGASQTVIDGGKDFPRNLTPDRWVVELNCSEHIRITIRGITIIYGGETRGGGNLVNKGCGLRLKDSALTVSGGIGIEHSGGRLSIEDSVISHSSNGGIVLESGTGALIHSTVFRNATRGSGGGVIIGESGTLRVHRSTISNNSALGIGGIDNDGKLEVTQSVITNNNTGPSSGGGIGNSGVATITDSLISENNAALSGGGIANSGELTLIRSTVRNNTASCFGGCSPDPMEQGGGIFNGGNEARLTLTSSLITENFANDDGGGVFNEGGTVSQTDTLIINNNPNDCVGC